MSQDDGGEASKDRGFLSRWSQRKREAAQPTADIAPVQPAAEPPNSQPLVETADEEPFDLESLPKLEDLTDSTDITGFLRKGVPEGLRNAALRKTWALDPAIRNYVNPAMEYAFDWNTPGGVPGAGEIAAGTDIAKMVLQIMGSDSAAAEADDAKEDQREAAANVPSASGDHDAVQDSGIELLPQQVRMSLAAETPMVHAAQQNRAEPAPGGVDSEVSREPSASQQAVQRHGSAKPKL
jgi:hypothetical protein